MRRGGPATRVRFAPESDRRTGDHRLSPEGSKLSAAQPFHLVAAQTSEGKKPAADKKWHQMRMQSAEIAGRS
jgi:hypothetical protein